MKHIALLALPMALLATSCAGPSRDAASAGERSCCVSNTEPAAAFTDKSLYQLDSTWTNDAGHGLTLGTLRGHVQVMALFFTSCTYACPIIVHDMKRIEAALPAEVRAHAGFTLITFDLERDTPDTLRAYRKTHRLPEGRWALLRGSPDDTLELAALIGVKFKREISGQFAHSNLITVLNAEGEIIHQLVGLNQDINDTVKRVVAAAKDAPGHTNHE